MKPYWIYKDDLAMTDEVALKGKWAIITVDLQQKATTHKIPCKL